MNLSTSAIRRWSLALMLFALEAVFLNALVSQGAGAHTLGREKWIRDKTLEWSFTPSVAANAAWRTAITKAAAQWNAVPGTGVQFRQIGNRGNFDPKVCPSQYQQNAIHRYRIDGPWGRGAEAHWCVFSDTLELYSFQITFDTSEKWYAGSGAAPAGTLDVWGFAVHEFGHTVGLGHLAENDPLCTDILVIPSMCPILYSNGTYQRDLDEHDIHAFKLLYGVQAPPPPAADTTAPTVSGASVSHGDATSPHVQYTFNAADDSGKVTEMRVLISGQDWQPWGEYVPSGTVTLPDTYGRFDISFQARDAAGNVSSAAQAGSVTRTAPVALSLYQTDNNGNLRSCGVESNPCTDVVKKFRADISSPVLPNVDLLFKVWRKVDGVWKETEQSPWSRHTISGTSINFEFVANPLKGLWRYQVQVPRDPSGTTDFAGSNYQYMVID